MTDVGEGDGGAERMAVGAAGGVADGLRVAEHGFAAPEHHWDPGGRRRRDVSGAGGPGGQAGGAAEEVLGPIDGEGEAGFERGFVGGQFRTEGAIRFFEAQRLDGVVAGGDGEEVVPQASRRAA